MSTGTSVTSLGLVRHALERAVHVETWRTDFTPIRVTLTGDEAVAQISLKSVEFHTVPCAVEHMTDLADLALTGRPFLEVLAAVVHHSSSD